MREMKDSGIEWIGEIPKEWATKRLKAVLCERTEINNPIKTDFILSLTNDRGVIPYNEKGDVGNKSKDDLTGYKLAYPNDIVLNSMNVIIGSVALSSYFGCVSPVYYMLYPRSSNDSTKYYNYLFQTKELQNRLKGYGNGIMEIRMRIQMSKLNTVEIPVPSSEEQHRIADYLDDKCGKIDRYIEQQKQVIEKLKAYKQSVITEAVTKGLDPTVPMKDSGVEWIGEIPESWVVVKATRLILSTQNGLTRRDLEKSNGNIVLKLRNINSRGEIDYSEINRIVLSSKEVETYQLIDGDFLFVRVNGSRSLVGKCAIYNGISEIVAYNDHIIRVRLNNFCDKDFFKWFLLSDVGKKEIDIHTSTSAGQFTISGDGLRNLNVILPKKEIQREIVVYLNQKCSSIDFAIAEKQNLIEKLTEYKKSLIYEVVTGKKEV